MKRDDIIRLAHSSIESNAVESDSNTAAKTITITLNGEIQNCQAIGGNGDNDAGTLDNGDGANGAEYGTL